MAKSDIKITVTQVFPLVVNNLITSLQKAAVVFVVSVFGFAFLFMSVPAVPTDRIQLSSIVVSTLITVVYWVSKILDAHLMAKGSFLELKGSQLSGESTGFSSNSFTVPIQKIATLYIHQDFLDKLFGICAVVFTQMNSTVSVYGFNHSDAQKFVQKFSDIQSTK